MRILQLTPGTGNFHCGMCLRDRALVDALRRRGHQVLMLPLYLPLVFDGGSSADGEVGPLFFGAARLDGGAVFFYHRNRVAE